MNIELIYALCPVVGYLIYQYLIPNTGFVKSLVVAILIAYLPTYFITDYLSRHGGYRAIWFQKLWIFNRLGKYLQGTIGFEEKLDSSKQYIFGNFPHGTCSANHVLTMTDCCEMISKHHTGDRRDLAASVLFFIPIVKEVSGCVALSPYPLIKLPFTYTVHTPSKLFTRRYFCCWAAWMPVPPRVTTT